VRHYRNGQISPAYQIKHREQTPTYHILDLSNRALIEVAEAEQYAGQHKAEHPSGSGSSEQIGYTIHQVTTINKFFSESGETPRKQQGYEKQLGVADKWTKVGQVRPSVEQAHQQRLRYEKLKQLICNSKQQSEP